MNKERRVKQQQQPVERGEKCCFLAKRAKGRQESRRGDRGSVKKAKERTVGE